MDRGLLAVWKHHVGEEAFVTAQQRGGNERRRKTHAVSLARRVGKAKRAHKGQRGHAEPVIGPAHRVRPLAGPMASSDRTRWLCPPYGSPMLNRILTVGGLTLVSRVTGLL